MTVKVYKGSKAKGTDRWRPVKATAPGGIGGGELRQALTSGTYTARAEEAQRPRQRRRHSETRTFDINTEPPEVGLNAVKTPSNNTKPSFSGTASESLQVTVKIYKGSKPEGTLVRPLKERCERKMGSGQLVDDPHERDLHGGRRRAQLARQPHGPQLGRTFVINTNRPK